MVKVDAHRRIYMPKDIPIETDKVVIIPHGSAYLMLPVPKEPVEIDVKIPVKELKDIAEDKARREAVGRASKRQHRR
ncbi:MAG: hypothetical protein HYY68_06385 [Thaumarchaeota archaeon]|nr:hypothetical protein [Nitrososphaerota archaeon]